MKRRKTLLIILLTTLLLVLFAFAVSAISFEDLMAAGIVNENQCAFLFDCQNGNYKTGLYIYDSNENRIVYTDAQDMPPRVIVVPDNPDSFHESALLTLPSVYPPKGDVFVGWQRIPVDENDTDASVYPTSSGGYTVQAQDIGRIVKFRALYISSDTYLRIDQTEPVQYLGMTYQIRDRVLYISGEGITNRIWVVDQDRQNQILEKVVIGKGITANHFYTLCTKAFEVDPESPKYTDVGGVLFNKDQTEIIAYPNGAEQTEYTVPESVQKICCDAFRNNGVLEKLFFQEGLTELEEGSIQYCPNLETIVFPASLRRIKANNFFDDIESPKTYTIKSMYTEFAENLFGCENRFKDNVPKDIRKQLILVIYGLIEPTEETQPYLDNIDYYFESVGPDVLYLGTIHCHAGSTAEAYAIEHGMDYELTHFFEGDWNYDWDNLVRWRKCIHCDERETEPLETETPGGAEIVGPADGDTSFDVEPVSTDYVLIQEVLGEQNVVKAFDISLKNQDGVHVQPKGTVKVKLPGDFKTGNYKVYRVNADGTYTDMQAFREGSHLVFYTDHFSLYVVVDESAQTEPDTPDTPDTPAKENKVYNILHTVFEFLQKLIRLLFVK